MICKSCKKIKSSGRDDIIKYICGHYVECEYFLVDKSTFISEFDRQVRLEAYKIKDQIEKKNSDSLAKKIAKKLKNRYTNDYYPIVPNIYLYDWESDVLAVNKETKYITEFEIKITREDFKADFKKKDKHNLIDDSQTYDFDAEIPNYFYYVTPPGLLLKSKLPSYCGLIEVGNSVEVLKPSPLLHTNPINKKLIDKLFLKVHNKYWNIYK